MKKLSTLIIILLFPLVGLACGVFGKPGFYVVVNKVAASWMYDKKEIAVYVNDERFYYKYETQEKAKSEFDRLMNLVRQCKFKQ